VYVITDVDVSEESVTCIYRVEACKVAETLINHCSSGNVMTRLRVGRPNIEKLFSTASRPTVKLTQAYWLIFSGLKRRNVNLTSQLHPIMKIAWSHISTVPHIFAVLCLMILKSNINCGWCYAELFVVATTKVCRI
jgi:hypothetical protein